MKTLPIAALALSAAAAQAFTLDLLVGTSRPGTEPVAGRYDTNTLAGIALAWKVSPRIALGVSATHRELEWKGGATAAGSDDALTASVDLNFDLGAGKGGLRPFFGLGLGNTWFDTAAGNQSAFTASAQAGIRMELSESTDLVLGMRRVHIVNVDFDNLAGNADEDVRAWETFAGLSFKF